MTKDNDIVITSAFRTPVGSFKGSLSGLKATELGSIVIKKCMEHSKLSSTLNKKLYLFMLFLIFFSHSFLTISISKFCEVCF